jgi:hypothetical protein
MATHVSLTYPPCCDQQDLAPLGGNIMQCRTCGEVLPPYAPVSRQIAEMEAEVSPLSDEQYLRMIGVADQIGAELEEKRR